MATLTVPIYPIIDAVDQADADRQKKVIEDLLNNQMLRMQLTAMQVRLVSMTIGEMYPCADPRAPQPIPQGGGYYNGGQQR